MKYKELIRYFIVGVLTTVIGFGVYYCLLCTVLNENKALELQIANVVSWICAVLFAFFANKKFVFHDSSSRVFSQLIAFATTRIITLLIENLILYIFVSVLFFDSVIVKLFAMIITTILNYVFGKKVVFRKPAVKNNE